MEPIAIVLLAVVVDLESLAKLVWSVVVLCLSALTTVCEVAGWRRSRATTETVLLRILDKF